METIRKIAGYILLLIVLIITIIAVLGIWDLIDLKHILSKTLSSLLVIFASSAIILFIFTVLINFKETSKKHEQ